MKTMIQSAVLTISLCLCFNAGAQIFYQDIDPDVVLSTWSVKDVNIDSLAGSTLNYGAPGNLSIWEEFGSQIVVNAFSDCQVMMNGSYPAALSLNQTISSAGTWVQPNYAVLNNGTQGNWMGVADKYIGVKVKSGTQWLYGWIRMDVNTAGTTVTIKDYACNRTADAAINAGQTTTSVHNDLPSGNEPAISIYPNPFSSSAMIKADEPLKGAAMSIYDLHGKLMKEVKNISGQEIKLYRDNLPSGAYFTILAHDKGIIFSGKLLITD